MLGSLVYCLCAILLIAFLWIPECYGTLTKDEYALMVAATNRKWEDMLALAKKGVSVDIEGDNGISPLSYAVQFSDAEIVDELIKVGVDHIVSKQIADGIKGKKEQLIKTESRNLLNKRDGFGSFPIYYAVDRTVFDKSMFDVLVKHGADPKEEKALLMYATLHCHKELAHILIDTYKFDAKWSDDFQITLLHDATDNDCDTEFMKILTSNGADVNACDENGETPLQMAVRRNRDVAVKALIELGADLEKVDTKNRTPLDYALKKGHIKVAKLLSAAIHAKKSEKPGVDAHKDTTAVGAHDKVSHAKAAPVQPPAGLKH